ncbi:MAG: nitroreductase family protein [Chloroflexi bacterium]|nr:nitroreductase family protein [Chloroflexota bacterium]
MDTWDSITSRRQVRSFASDPIPKPDLERILEAGRRAPSSRNGQQWDFVVVSDKGQLEQLSQVWQGAGWVVGSAATIALVIPKSDGDESLIDRFDLGQALYKLGRTDTATVVWRDLMDARPDFRSICIAPLLDAYIIAGETGKAHQLIAQEPEDGLRSVP